jgi:hypothetical protein
LEHEVNIVSVDTVKPVVKSVTVTLSKAEIVDLAYCYEKYYGLSTFVKNLKAAANGDPVTLTPATPAF